MVSTMVYVHTILRDVAGLFKVGRLVAYYPITFLRRYHLRPQSRYAFERAKSH